MPAMQIEQHVGIEIDERDRNRRPPVADPAGLHFQFMGGHQGALQSGDAVEPLGEIDVLGNIGQGFLFSDHSD